MYLNCFSCLQFYFLQTVRQTETNCKYFFILFFYFLFHYFEYWLLKTIYLKKTIFYSWNVFNFTSQNALCSARFFFDKWCWKKKWCWKRLGTNAACSRRLETMKRYNNNKSCFLYEKKTIWTVLFWDRSFFRKPFL